jgi:hypothetical protein
MGDQYHTREILEVLCAATSGRRNDSVIGSGASDVESSGLGAAPERWLPAYSYRALCVAHDELPATRPSIHRVQRSRVDRDPRDSRKWSGFRAQHAGLVVEGCIQYCSLAATGLRERRENYRIWESEEGEFPHRRKETREAFDSTPSHASDMIGSNVAPTIRLGWGTRQRIQRVYTIRD